METKNLGNNFLFLLGKRWVKSGSLGPYETEMIYAKFSDIPDVNISTQLESLQSNGFIAMTPGRDQIYPTDRGIGQIQFLLSTE